MDFDEDDDIDSILATFECNASKNETEKSDACVEKPNLTLIQNEDLFSKETQANRIENTNELDVKQLFGDFSDSEDDCELNEYGKKIKQTLKRGRFDIGLSTTAKSESNAVSTKEHSRVSTISTNREIDAFLGIKVLNPRISFAEMKQLSYGRKLVKVSQMKHFVKGSKCTISGDWAVVGVVVQKAPQKLSKAGKMFSVFKLCDLSVTETTLNLYLFGNVNAVHWKMNVGSVIGLLNPEILEKREKRENVSLTIDDPLKLLYIGTSQELDFCKAQKKNGDICGSIINKSNGKHCLFHLKADYAKMCAQRQWESADNFAAKKKSFGSKPIGSSTSEKWPNDKGEKKQPIVDPLRLQQLKEEASMRKEREAQTLLKAIKAPLTLAAKNFSVIANLTESNDQNLNNEVGSKSAKEVLSKLNKNFSVVKQKPVLGKGLKLGDEIDFNQNSTKMKALQFLKSKPILKEDPNVTRRRLSLEKIMKKVEENIASDELEIKDEKKRKKENMVEAKRRKLEAMQEIMNRKSKHEAEVIQVEKDAEEKYFKYLEKKEMTEERMRNATEYKCKVVICNQCKYTAHSVSQLCVEKKHSYFNTTAVKRFFKCKSCSHRVYTFNCFYPTQPCRKCNDNSFEKTSMYNIKEPKEKELLIRGDEIPFLNR
ncbi:MCM10-like protein [Dinothrombium tinctorium]|uniref:Protein MCM10 homolog n=1 Tax=Dinothrombium tinctorium TaxID=1965070 RepID=A0A3S3P509_9ACAR|nr:MCM10-like protein [Dinothrombium tinctorium]RWS04094.1 MCM10-like protein [Dinothrombium tinctorium]